VAISNATGEATFVLDGSFSTIDRSGLAPRNGAKKIAVHTRRLEEVLAERADGHIDLLDVDCEGLDLTVLQSNDW
jgi:FkbM family methyltransferase